MIIKKLKNIKSYFQIYKREILYKNDIKQFFEILNKIYEKDNKYSFNHKIFIECYWDNPGYWFSLSLILRAISIDKSNCIAIISKDKNN